MHGYDTVLTQELLAEQRKLQTKIRFFNGEGLGSQLESAKSRGYNREGVNFQQMSKTVENGMADAS